MRLRNKKTGGIYEADYMLGINVITELSEDWEVYKPKEPLIKDEKIRKAVRAWAEACNLKHVTYKQASNEFYDADTRGKFAIKFALIPIEVYLEDGESYTIAELCGEDEA